MMMMLVENELTLGILYVSSAIESDAQYAVEKLHNHEFQGRRMRLGALPADLSVKQERERS